MGMNVPRLEQVPIGTILANRLSAVAIGLHAAGDLKAGALESEIKTPCAGEQREDLHGRPHTAQRASLWVSGTSVGPGIAMPHRLIPDPQDGRPGEAPHRTAPEMRSSGP